MKLNAKIIYSDANVMKWRAEESTLKLFIRWQYEAKQKYASEPYSE